MQKKNLQEEYKKLNEIVEWKRNDLKKDKDTLANIKAQIKGYELLEELNGNTDDYDPEVECLLYVTESNLKVKWEEYSPEEYSNFLNAKLIFKCKYKNKDCKFVVKYNYSQTYNNRCEPDQCGEYYSLQSNSFTDFFSDYLSCSYSDYELDNFIKKYS